MNKHALTYHTRLHDWYRQHSILQKQHQHYDTDLVQPEEERIENLTKDKFHFINDWRSEVNKTFFKVKKTKPKSLVYLQGDSSSYRDSPKSTDLQPIRSSDVFTLSNKRSKQPKALAKHGGLLLPGKVNTHNIYNNASTLTKKYTRSTQNINHLDLCIRSSKEGLMGNKDLSRKSPDSFNVTDKAPLFKQKGRLSSVQNINSISNQKITPRRGNNLYRNYRLIDALRRARSVAHDDNYLRSVTTKNSSSGIQHQTAEQDRATAGQRKKSEKHFISDGFHAISYGSFTASKMKKACIDKGDKSARAQAAKGMTHVFPQVMLVFCTACGGICSDDREPLPSPAPYFCGNCIHRANIKTGQNVDPSPKFGTLKEYKQEKVSKRLPREEINMDGKITLAEKISIQVMVRAKEDIVCSNLHSDNIRIRAEQTKQTIYEGNSYNGIRNNKNISIANSADGYNSTERSVQAEGNTKCEYGTNNADDDNAESKKTVIQQDNMLQNDNFKERNTSLCESVDAIPDSSAHSVASQLEDSRGGSFLLVETPVLSNMCLSNSLLNVLTIDDCKVSQRYNLHKINAPVKQEVQDDQRIGHELVNSNKISLHNERQTTSKVTMGTINEVKNVRPTSLLLDTVSGAHTVNKKLCKMLSVADGQQSSRNKRPNSAKLEKAFHILINDRTILQRIDLVNSKSRKSAWTITRKNEGHVYKRLHAALRRHIEEIVQSRCAKMLHGYKVLGSDSVQNKAKVDSFITEPSMSLSECLPVVRKGILKYNRTNNVYVSSDHSVQHSDDK